MICPRCNGKMRIKDYQIEEGDMPCPTCEGEGEIEEEDESYERLHNENFVETDYKALNEIAKGRIPAGYKKY